MLMEHCDDPGALPDNHPYDGLEVRNSYHADRYIGRRLRERGWLPSSTKRMDVEGMVLDGCLVAIDYENLYHEDWMFDPLCWRWSKFLRWDTPILLRPISQSLSLITRWGYLRVNKD